MAIVAEAMAAAQAIGPSAVGARGDAEPGAEPGAASAAASAAAAPGIEELAALLSEVQRERRGLLTASGAAQ